MSDNAERQIAERLFNENFAAISAAKQQTGDWERAYQAVTGRSWPSGANVEIKNGQGRAIDDLPWWRDAAKYAGPVAGIAAAPFTGGLSAALIGAGAGAAGSAISGGGVGDALKWAGLGAGAGYGADKLFGAIGGASNLPGQLPSLGGSGNGESGNGLSDAIKRLAVGGGAAALGRSLGGNANPGAATANLPPEFQQVLALAMRRMADQEPLFQAVNAQAMGGLPTAYQRG